MFFINNEPSVFVLYWIHFFVLPANILILYEKGERLYSFFYPRVSAPHIILLRRVLKNR